ncbi:hypothetical protein Calag_0770 [Caldisphaera lagunensis DSM 15908]|uniref:Uncharacterized protein n=1 Tax=Caldisphaera lagunensis (strain DSM 15908 / JCM 11604 / ANMR 0165 / IC-154) TaxID=1056495 RepID=L0A9D9_CALLD|nr:hypothetical protein [Caldisphaera lagunensis]AFZ70513.1 hypothetical protein Calag_0770 [Caldisphaera lagunensis DSM 15908]
MTCYIDLDNVNDLDEISDELNDFAEDISTIQDYLDEHMGDFIEKLNEALNSEGIVLSCNEAKEGNMECKYKFQSDLIGGEVIFLVEIDPFDNKIKDYDIDKIRLITK